LLALVLGGLACGSAAPPAAALVAPVAPAGPPVPLGDGEAFVHADEQFAFEVRVHGVLVGEAAMASGKPGLVDGRRVVVTRSRAESAGLVGMVKRVRDEVTTSIDMASARPIRLDGDLTFGERHVLVTTRFTDAGYELQVTRDGQKPVKRFQRLPAGQPVYDSHAAIARLRAWTPEPGQRAYFYVVGGRFLWHNMVQLTARETVRTSLGTFPALRIDGLATRVNSRLGYDIGKKPRTYTVWVSDDADRVPLKVLARTELGNLEVELVHYERPSRRLIARGR
jgi:hypothetical protein